MTRRGWLGGMAAMAGIGPGTAIALPAPLGDGERLEIWPGSTGPGSAGADLHQRLVERSSDPARPDRFYEGITRPFLTIHRPARPDGRSLLITPGGGYQRVVVDKEGGELAPLLTGRGITTFTLTYRLPGEVPQHGPDMALQDAQRALRLIRQRAGTFAIDPEGTSVLGFSAGGHVAAMLGTRHAENLYAPVDAADSLSARPARLALVYPVIDMGAHAHAGSRTRLLGPAPDAGAVASWSAQTRVSAATPRSFLLHANDDEAVPVENSLLFHAACRAAGVPADLHLYARGGHGFGHGPRIAPDNPLRHWPDLLLDWWADGR